LNLLLYRLEEAGAPWPQPFIGYDPGMPETTSDVLLRFLQHVANNRNAIHPTDPSGWLRTECHALADQHLGLLRCTSGITKNLLEFVRHSLGQIEAQDAEQRSYDQSYLLSNSTGRRRRSRLWPVQPGPGMLIVLAHSAC